MSGQMEDIYLKADNGENVHFLGRLFSESSHFDEESRCFTRQQLYITDSQEQVYYIVQSCGQERSRRLYKLAVHDDNCVINNGQTQINLSFDMLMLAVQVLYGLNADEMLTIEDVEELLKAANA